MEVDAMDSTTLQRWQAKVICAALFPAVNYLIRLRQRMEATGFPHNDELYRPTCAAHDAVNHLRIKAHYLSCSGTGAPGCIGK
jgi:hypothetical protein